MTDASIEKRLELELAPEWEAIHQSWTPCMEHLAREGVDSDTAYSLCMVAQELLENAVKYGAFEPGRERIRLHLSGHEGTFTVEVRSPLAADVGVLARLDGMVQWIRGFQNPFEAFVERLKAVSASGAAQFESGLGLVRIAYEGQCVLDFFVDESNVLAMSAIFQAEHKARG